MDNSGKYIYAIVTVLGLALAVIITVVVLFVNAPNKSINAEQVSSVNTSEVFETPINEDKDAIKEEIQKNDNSNKSTEIEKKQKSKDDVSVEPKEEEQESIESEELKEQEINEGSPTSEPVPVNKDMAVNGDDDKPVETAFYRMEDIPPDSKESYNYGKDPLESWERIVEDRKHWKVSECPEYFDYTFSCIPDEEVTMYNNIPIVNRTYEPYQYEYPLMVNTVLAVCEYKGWDVNGDEINSLEFEYSDHMQRYFDNDRYSLKTPDKGFYNVWFDKGKAYIEDATEKVFENGIPKD